MVSTVNRENSKDHTIILVKTPNKRQPLPTLYATHPVQTMKYVLMGSVTIKDSHVEWKKRQWRYFVETQSNVLMKNAIRLVNQLVIRMKIVSLILITILLHVY